MNNNIDYHSMLSFLQTQDSLFPIGAFSLSNGLETFVQENRIRTPEELREYVAMYLSILPYNELGVMALAWGHEADMEYICMLDNIYSALKSAREIREGSKRLCKSFLKLIIQMRADNGMKADDSKEGEFSPGMYLKLIEEGRCTGQHSIAVGLYGAQLGINICAAGAFYGYNILSAIVTNAVKSVPLSQTQGQKILNGALLGIEEASKRASSVSIDDIGVGAAALEIAAMRHEQLYSRLYMS